MHEEISKWFLKGIAASPGIVIGKACILQDVLLMVERRTLEEVRAEEEVSRLRQAIRQVIGELMEDSSQMALKIGKRNAEIFLAHLAILQDPYFIARILKDIRQNGVNAESAVKRQVDKFSGAFRKMEDPYLRERGADLRDLGRRVIQKLMPPQQTPWDLKEPVILVSPELTPSDTVRLDKEKVLAFATESGGKDSHAAILARSLGIPAVLGIEGLLSRVKKGDTLIVDGDTGILLVRPPVELIQNYQDLQKKRELYQTELYKLVSLPSQTLDGREIRLWANIGGLTDLEYSLRFGAYGVGLFRTELPFLVWKRFLSEEEQFSLYQKVVTQAAGREVTIRTLDFGGDKFFEDSKNQKERNPFLGYRSIRVFLKEKDLFKQQIRAILRASAFGPGRILFPMVSSMEEIRQIKDLFELTKTELRKEGIPFNERIPFGIMIEVPSAAILADQLAKEVDFFSIGTNDLVQYTLAVDRTNDLVTDIYKPLNPAVLRLIQKIVQVANDEGKEVTLCGEMAGTPTYVPLLIGIGLADLSMNPSSLLEAKKIIRKTDYHHWKSVAGTALGFDSVGEIDKLITSENNWMGFESQNGPVR